MSDVEQTCRICRGEATTSQPLIHPCKCRGSIKFIHQDCLLMWLNHSNKEKRCDICNTAYHFKTIYDPNMPSRIPIEEIYQKIVLIFKKAVVKYTSIALYAICLTQLSIFWKFVGRLFTYIADEKLSSPNLSVLNTLLYGAYVNRTRSGVLLESPDATLAAKLETFLVNTFVQGNLQVVIFILVLVVLFIEHEWVVREEGYKALLLRQMGKRPRTKLADLLASLAQNETGDNEMMANRALEDLRRVQETNVHENALRAAIEQRQFDVLLHQAVARAPRNPLPDIDIHARNNDSDSNTSNDQESDPALRDNASLNDGRNVEYALNGDTNVQNEHDQPIDAHNSSDDEAVDDFGEQRDWMDDELNAAMAENGDFWELLGFKLDILTPIQLAIFADTAILTFLLMAYLVPHSIGKFFLLVCATSLIGVFYVFIKPILSLPGLNLLPELAVHAYKKAGVPMLVETFFRELLVDPIVEAFRRLTHNKPFAPPNMSGRVVPLSAGYFVICFVFHRYMSVLISGPKPIMGRSRKIYEIMFQIKATVKVFTIFASEIVLFPVYCGWLLDFCIAPLINEMSISTTGERVFLYPLTTPLKSLGLYSRFFIYWVLGTWYMFCVALFVSMVRKNILRPGVLYFIKSPEDPNARLIHDAIVKPFFLQISRIFLSAKVYTAFVVLGIGSVTWGMRFLVNSPGSDGALLPIQRPTLSEIFLALLTTWILFNAKQLIAKQLLLFWKRSFAVLSHKFRLSHFLLDEPVPQERGYVVYRSLLHKLSGFDAPDYSKPVSYSEAKSLFNSEPSVSAYFVPDGTYIRAPSSDDNSRKFLRSLFVPVTKSDQLISPEQTTNDVEESDWWDENTIYEDNYTIVYTPPHNKMRCLALVCMVILFGALLIVSIVMTAALIGRPIVSASAIMTSKLLENKVGVSMWDHVDWKYLDVQSLCVGLIMLTQGVFLIDRRPSQTEVRAFVVNQGRMAEPFLRNYFSWLRPLMSGLLYMGIELWILILIYQKYVPTVEIVLQSFNKRSDMWERSIWPGLLLRAAYFPFTFMPMIDMFRKRSQVPILSLLLSPFSYVAPQLISAMGFISIHKLFAFVAEKQGFPLTPGREVFISACVSFAIVATQVVYLGLKFLRGVHEEIKNEKYVKGTAIQNIAD